MSAPKLDIAHCNGKLKNKKYHTVGYAPKSNSKIVVTDTKSIPLRHRA